MEGETTTQTVDDVSRALDANALGKGRIAAIVLCAIVAMLDGFDTQSIGFVAPLVSEEFSIGSEQLGAVFSAGLAGLMLGAFVISPVADRIGRKPTVVLTTALFGALALATAFVENTEQLLILRFLTGFGLGGAMPVINTLTSELAPQHRRAFLMTAMFVGFPLGAVVGGVLSTGLIAAYGWRSVFIVGGLLPLVLVPVLFFFLPESPRFLASRVKQAGDMFDIRAQAVLRRLRLPQSPSAAPANPARSPASLNEEREQPGNSGPAALFRDGRASTTLSLWVVFFVNLLVLHALLTWLPSVMMEAGLTLDQAIIATVVLNAGGIVGGLIIARLIDTRPARRIMTITYIGAAGFVAAIGQVSTSLAASLAVIFIAGCCVIGAQFGMNALASASYPTPARNTGLGWALAVGRIGSLIGPLVVGVFVGLRLPLEQLFAAGGALFVFAIIAILLLPNKQPDAA